jgi:hypothetical protein
MKDKPYNITITPLVKSQHITGTYRKILYP